MRFHRQQSLLAFAGSFFALLVLHGDVLRLPYFWDEAGYYVPAARDILVSGSLIPLSSISNAHPPLVMLWLAGAWKVLGYSIPVTRIAMLLVAGFALTGLFRLAQRAANTTVAFCSIALTALYPVFFAQSSLGQVDMAAAGLTFWGLTAYLEDRPGWVVFWFCLAVLTKETALLTPAVLAGWECCSLIARRWLSSASATTPRWEARLAKRIFLQRSSSARDSAKFGLLASLALPLLPLSLWYAYHFAHTGYIFGNPEFVRYNVTATFSLERITLAIFLRLWQVFGYMHLWTLTGAMLLAMLLPPVRDQGEQRPRIGTAEQVVLLIVVLAHVVAMSLIGGAVLARYMLPAVPLVIVAAVSTLWRRLRWWRTALVVIGMAFVAAWFWNPPYGFSPEDNLSYRDFVHLHQDAARYLEEHDGGRRVLTAWPATDELTRPWLGYVGWPLNVMKINDFSDTQIEDAARLRDSYDVALVFSTKYEPAHPLKWEWTAAWERTKSRIFDFHRDVTPAVAAEILGGRIAFSEQQHGQWIAVIQLEPGLQAATASQP